MSTPTATRHVSLPVRIVLDALDDRFVSASALAKRVSLTAPNSETVVTQACEALERLGLAERGGFLHFRLWRRARYPEQ